MKANISKEYVLAKRRYLDLGVDTGAALKKLKKVSLSLHCWQGDDVSGFENEGVALSGGIAVTGNRFGKAKTPEMLRKDLEKALSFLPGKHRVNLHASYGDFRIKKNDRNEVSRENFTGWVAWAKSLGLKLDFNSTFFSHPKANEGFTLSSKDPAIRSFWVEHSERIQGH